MIFILSALAADSGGAALFAAAGLDATTASFDAALAAASENDVKFRDEYRYTVLHKMQRGNTKLAEYIDDPAGTTTKSLPKELASLLFELGLGEKVDVAGKWCYEMGAESLEDLGETQGFGDTMDFVMEFAMALEPLPPIKKAKLVRRIRQALAKHKTEL